jgi:hypothetical protein
VLTLFVEIFECAVESYYDYNEGKKAVHENVTFRSWRTEEYSSICIKGAEVHIIGNQNIFKVFIYLFNYLFNDAISNSDYIRLITGRLI